ncbi:MAG: putative S-layer protein [Candidatus Pacearchaeota archaeon]
MKTKLISLIFGSILFISLITAFSLTYPGSISLSKASPSSVFTISNTNSEDVVLTLQGPYTITDGFGHTVTFILSPSMTNFNLPAGNSTQFNISLVQPIDSGFGLGTFTKTFTLLVANASNLSDSENKNFVVSFKKEYCDAGNTGKLKINKLDIKNLEGYGEDDEWYLLDKIEVEVEVKNTGNDDIDDVVVEWGLYNKRTGEFVFDDEEKSFNLRDGARKTVTFGFDVNPNDFDESDREDDFVFYVKAFSDDVGENVECASDSENIKLIRDSHFVVLSDIELPNEAQCGEIVQGRARAWNIGDDDEENIYLTITNSNLGLNKRMEIGDLDVLEDKLLSFDFLIPSSAKSGSYPVLFRVYNEDDEIYENDNDEQSVLTKTITLKGNCAGDTADNIVSISAVLESDAVAGKDLNVKATLRNRGTSETTYQIIVTNYDSWASLKSVEPRSVNISPGASKDVSIVLLPNSDSSGSKEFTIQAVYDGKITEQRVGVNLEPSSSRVFSFTGFAIAENIKENWFIWLIAALNVILVIFIIIVAVRVIRR